MMIYLARTFLLILIASACGKDGDKDRPKPQPPPPNKINSPTYLNCPKGTNLTYENFGEAFLVTYCTSCHSRGLAVDNRAGAPTRVNFDQLEDVARWRTLIRSTASDPRTAKMPPKTPINVEERKYLREWLDCGAPGETETLKTADQ